MATYRIEKYVPCRSGAFVEYGGTYRWLWAAKVAKWIAELCPDLRDYKLVRIESIGANHD